jgi:membrane protein DedA with SNARE-associated domain
MNWQTFLPALGDFFSSHPYLGVSFAGFIAFIESLAIVGSIVPGSIVMTMVGFLLGMGVLPIKPTLISIFIGAIIGDYISFGIGIWYKEHAKNHHWIKPYQNWIIHGETFMKKYGGFSILIGRFFGPMRSIIPLIAGLAGMEPLRFTLAIIPTIILWAAVYLAPGVALGALSVDMGESCFFQILSSLFIYLILFVLWHSTQSILRLCTPLHRHISFINSENLTHLIKGSLLLIFSTVLVYQQYHYQPSENWLNRATYFYSIIHSSELNIKIAQVVSLSTGHIAFILMNAAVSLVLYYHRHKKFAIVWIFSSASLFLTTYALKYSLLISRPNPILDSTGFPSGHILLFSTFFLCLSIVIEHCSLISSILLRRMTFLIIFAIGLSRLILQAHWFLDVVASGLLSLGIWHLLSVFKNYIPKIPSPHARQIGSAILLILIPYTTIYQQLPSDIRPNIQKILHIDHLDELDQIPNVRYSRFGQVVAPINFIFVGNHNELSAFFTDEGFYEYPGSGSLSARISTLLYYSEYHDILPILPPLFDQKPPNCVFGKTDESHAYIVKLWNIPGKLGVYIGTASLETYPESFFASSFLQYQKHRFNLKPMFSEKSYIHKTSPLSITNSKNAFCWNGETFLKK